MSDLCLSINAGSSSLKTTIFKLGNPPVRLATATVAGLTAPPVVFKYQHGDDNVKKTITEESMGAPEAFQYIVKYMKEDPNLKEVQAEKDLPYFLHRVVHGGTFDREVVIDDDKYQYLEELSDLAPLHNFASLEIIKESRNSVPTARNIAFFDSVFHQSMPDYIKTYPIDQKIAKSNWLRKYGFHGISYAFITENVAKFLKKPASCLNIIACHLGSGTSVCAIKNGKSLDTSMGLTPLAGLPGATRSGSIDPSLVFHYTSETGRLSERSTSGMHVSQAEELLNKKAGWKSLIGTTDFSACASPNPPSDMHKLAFDIVVDRIVGYIGSYYTKLEAEVDALVFAAGIGEKSSYLREKIVDKCHCLGFSVDIDTNDRGPGNEIVTDVSVHGSGGPRVLVCQTDEMYQMAKLYSERRL
ncbi:hypothetical protein KEM56_001421 [Ascosphaera pollenicola]|nr:hypothetical protein KEM56_001421 [Ascosphaera pollenicola]